MGDVNYCIEQSSENGSLKIEQQVGAKSKMLGVYTKDVVIGREPSVKPINVPERCRIADAPPHMPRQHAVMRRRPHGWFLERVPGGQPDTRKQRSTWLQLSTGCAYYMPAGCRDGSVALSTAKADFQIQILMNEPITAETGSGDRIEATEALLASELGSEAQVPSK